MRLLQVKWYLWYLWYVVAMVQAKPKVTIANGQLEGFTLTSRDGREFSAFTSVPFAKAPLGKLRLKSPEPAQNWKGVLKADKELPLCSQIQIYSPYMRNQTIGQEDCLYLNVFTPKLGKDAGLPVMVYLHGGGFRSDAPAINKANQARYFMDKDVVLVIPNYRLSALGFLSTEDAVISGNFGLKDQVEALRWVKKNIKQFGGDPNQVTVFGNTAGGASAHFLMLSPVSKDLFARGISNSGSALAFWSLGNPGLASYRAKQLAAHVGCPASPSSALLECLQEKPAADIIESERVLNVDDYNPVVLYPPTIESADAPDAFLSVSPFNLPQTKPWMTGVNSGEGAFKLLSFKANPVFYKRFISNLDEMLPMMLMHENTTSHCKLVNKRIINKYFSKKESYDDAIKDVFSSQLMWWPSVKAVQLSLKSKPAPDLYYYVFNHRGRHSFTDLLVDPHGKSYGYLGVGVADDLLHLFDFEDELGEMNKEDETVSKRMVDMWTNFAIHGKPTLDGGWPKFTGSKREYLKIGFRDQVERDPMAEDMSFWDSLPMRDVMQRKGL